MNERQQHALLRFNRSIQELKSAGVIRSDRYLGDIAEFLCADAYGIDLATNQRQAGHDGVRQNLKVQIKYGGGKKTNMDLGDPSMYDEVYVVLGKDSEVRKHVHSADFLVYCLTKEDVKKIGTTPGGRYSCGASQFDRPPDRCISITEAGNP
ncbi:hypothetical protein Sbal625DRAFT_3896 [Shewanella baltica OS625]|uniref:DUF6998 domain-containing protein n=1 Tax=Shewanella baltica TaxID=62322 RepID=UPI000230D44E|nr:kelch repeat-containing protein [Shewanella baltica]EHC04307.1 hypothetical protein Sbal625DRAFT_3896 [Shewanella baltica OS625]